MDPLFLSRVQFALTASFHFIYPPLSMGLGLLLVIIGVNYLRTRDPKWRQLSFFWVKVYGLVFAIGVATGIVQEFEFGTNWPEYSRFVGNIFGSLLAAEGVFAFFLEGGFLGLMLFGGNRLGPRMWLLAIFMVAFGAHFSALWILMANSWMQTPAGYVVTQTPMGTQAFMTSFSETVFTPSFMPRLWHTWVAAWMTGAALMLSVGAWFLLRVKQHAELGKATIRVALPVFVIFSIVQVPLFGARQAENVTQHQPVKLAAMEGLWEDTACAPMTVIGWVDAANQTTYGYQDSVSAELPGLRRHQRHRPGAEFLSGGYVAAVNDLPVLSLDDQPGDGLHRHRAAGCALLFLEAPALAKHLHVVDFVLTIFLTEVATIVGWWTAEFGRQPWIVWELLRTVDAGSPVLLGYQVLISNGMFILLYAILFMLFIFLLNEKIQHGPDSLASMEERPVNALPDTFREIFRRQSRA
jgi:cytochrome d ubiquinol oxidase subunit I